MAASLRSQRSFQSSAPKLSLRRETSSSHSSIISGERLGQRGPVRSFSSAVASSSLVNPADRMAWNVGVTCMSCSTMAAWISCQRSSVISMRIPRSGKCSMDPTPREAASMMSIVPGS